MQAPSIPLLKRVGLIDMFDTLIYRTFDRLITGQPKGQNTHEEKYY